MTTHREQREQEGGTLAKPAGALWALACLGIAATAFAQSTPLALTTELQVNQFTAGAQVNPAVAMSPTGVHVIVWESFAQDGDGMGIVQRKFPADGSAPFNESVLNQSTAGDQQAPRIGMKANSDWIAVWQTTASGAKVRGRASGNGGTTLGNEFAVSETTGLVQEPDAARTDNGGFVAGWSGVSAIRFFDGTLQPITDDLSPAPALSSISRPRIAPLPAGGSVVSMDADDNDDRGVFAQRFDAAGDPVGDLIPVPESESHGQLFAEVESALDGSFVVAWEDSTDGVRLRCFDADGEPRSAELGITSFLLRPAIAVAPSGAFVVTYGQVDVFAREFDRTCKPVGPQFSVNSTTLGLQLHPVAAAGNDRFVIVWDSENLDGSSFGIARRLYRFRSIFADDFESGDDSAWSNGGS